MTSENASVEALRRATGDDGALHVSTLPGPVSDAMQALVNARVHECVHVATARDLPPGAMPKMCVRGAPMIWCATNPVCTVEAMQAIKLWRGVRIDDSCVMCGRAQTAYRTVFEDQAAGLSMVAWLCRDELARLAGWVGLP